MSMASVCRSIASATWRRNIAPLALVQNNGSIQATRHQHNQHRSKSSVPEPPSESENVPNMDQIHAQAVENASNFDEQNNYRHEHLTVHRSVKTLLRPMKPHLPAEYIPRRVPNHIALPPYARTGMIPQAPNHIIIQDKKGIDSLRRSAKIARSVLDKACALAKPGMTTNEIDEYVHQFITDEFAYPSPLNYAGFPKSVCSSINEVVCHGIPDQYKLKKGDVASFDVSCFFDGYHGDNCGTILIGDDSEDDEEDNGGQLSSFQSKEEEELFITGRRLIKASKEALEAGIATCRDGSCLTHVGEAIETVADAYGYSSVEKYRGHGIGRDFHCAPFVKHYRNEDYLELKEGMVFTIEPMICEGHSDCIEWSDNWTVVTRDGGRSSQFEHMVAITKDGAEILTLP